MPRSVRARAPAAGSRRGSRPGRYGERGRANPSRYHRFATTCRTSRVLSVQPVGRSFGPRTTCELRVSASTATLHVAHDAVVSEDLHFVVRERDCEEARSSARRVPSSATFVRRDRPRRALGSAAGGAARRASATRSAAAERWCPSAMYSASSCSKAAPISVTSSRLGDSPIVCRASFGPAGTSAARRSPPCAERAQLDVCAVREQHRARLCVQRFHVAHAVVLFVGPRVFVTANPVRLHRRRRTRRTRRRSARGPASRSDRCSKRARRRGRARSCRRSRARLAAPRAYTSSA